MDRRSMLRAAALATWPALLPGLRSAATAQPRVFRVGVLGVTDWAPGDPWSAPLVEELARLGYVQGRNLLFVPRAAGGDLSRLDALAAELVALKVDAILSDGGTSTALAAKRATSTIPIVLHASRDPVADGLVASLAKPGGNVTGNADMGADLMVKRLQLLIEATGTKGPVGYLTYQALQARASERETIAALESFARSAGVRLIVVTVRELSPSSGPDFENGVASLRRQGVAAALINNFATIGVAHDEVAAILLRHRLPAAMEDRAYSLVGVLMTYTEPGKDLAIRAARLLDRVLKGERPADLPMSQPSRFELVINLRTARHLGLAIPNAMLAQADELIR